MPAPAAASSCWEGNRIVIALRVLTANVAIATKNVFNFLKRSFLSYNFFKVEAFKTKDMSITKNNYNTFKTEAYLKIFKRLEEGV